MMCIVPNLDLTPFWSFRTKPFRRDGAVFACLNHASKTFRCNLSAISSWKPRHAASLQAQSCHASIILRNRRSMALPKSRSKTRLFLAFSALLALTVAMACSMRQQACINRADLFSAILSTAKPRQFLTHARNNREKNCRWNRIASRYCFNESKCARMQRNSQVRHLNSTSCL